MDLRLLPWQFSRLTPQEWEWLWRGEVKRQKRRWFQVATLGTWMLAPWSKKTPTAEQLLGWRDRYRED